jgi:hypothetical protein
VKSAVITQFCTSRPAEAMQVDDAMLALCQAKKTEFALIMKLHFTTDGRIFEKKKNNR